MYVTRKTDADGKGRAYRKGKHRSDTWPEAMTSVECRWQETPPYLCGSIRREGHTCPIETVISTVALEDLGIRLSTNQSVTDVTDCLPGRESPS